MNLKKNRHIKVYIVLFVFAFTVRMFLFPGEYDGGIRGDWDMNLYGEYDLVRVNSHCIEISKKAGEGGWRTMIPRFFVTGFSIRELYILLEGIPTADEFISDHEKEALILNYYALDTTDDSVIGPVDTADELSKALDLSGIDWTPVTDPPDLPNVNY